MGDWLHAGACVAVPCLIGGVMFLLFDAWDRRRRRARAEDGLPVIEYLI
jgi:hypothetical protein